MADVAVPVHFLMFNVDARDGVCRAVLTLANQLAASRPVGIISLYRLPGGPTYTISDQIKVTYLFDHPAARPQPDGTRPPRPEYARRLLTRHPLRNLRARRRSRLAMGFGFPRLSLLTDQALERALRQIPSGIVVSTRPALHLAAARLTRPDVITIGQDHINFRSRSNENGSLALIEAAAQQGLDAFVTLTQADADDYALMMAGRVTRVSAIPNALSWPIDADGGPGESRVVVAAGRLVPRKGFARLITAFAPVARRHPDWTLRIYGDGRLGAQLSTQVERLGLTGQITLEGHTNDLPAAFEDAAFFASASKAEGFPMVMLEALSKGLPLVSFDCPRGPSDIINEGKNGLLVRDGDLPGLTQALEQVVSDGELRRAMGARARLDAEDYLGERITARWEELFKELEHRT